MWDLSFWNLGHQVQLSGPTAGQAPAIFLSTTGPEPFLPMQCGPVVGLDKSILGADGSGQNQHLELGCLNLNLILKDLVAPDASRSRLGSK